MKGLLKKTTLVTLNVTAMPCRVEETFEVSLKNVRVIEAEGLWLKDLSPEKRKVYRACQTSAKAQNKTLSQSARVGICLTKNFSKKLKR
ncbi:MAG: hypothetical protein KME06_14585 [Kastovskya adunca ATA6-11-RM4]|nr:hypothetical protein [Kastovskya adunca ATA6-11-RM4]